jgi:hypothetical protein
VAGSPIKPRPGPSSPLAKQLDDILARSATTMEKVQRSPLKGVGMANANGAGSPLASARRRLDLGNNKEVHFIYCRAHVIMLTIQFFGFSKISNPGSYFSCIILWFMHHVSTADFQCYSKFPVLMIIFACIDACMHSRKPLLLT